MFLFRKNIILVPTDYDGASSSKGLLSFDAYTGKTICNLKTYNLEIENEILLGVSTKNNFYKVKIAQNQSKNVSFDLDVELKNSDNLSAVLIDVKKKEYNILLWGSTQINKSWQTQLEFMIERENLVEPNKAMQVEISKNIAENSGFEEQQKEKFEEQKEKFENDKFEVEEDLFQKQTKVFQDFQNNGQRKELFEGDTNFCENGQKNEFNLMENEKKQNEILNENFEDESDVVLNEYIDKVIELSDIEETEENENFEVEQPFEESEYPKFYKKLSPQIDKMFEENQQEQILNEIIPNSKFCKVEFDDGSGYYIFGVIYENGMPKYLCYGLPSKKDAKPPKEMTDFYQWLPVDANSQDGDGFYMMYQDAETGKNISVEIV